MHSNKLTTWFLLAFVVLFWNLGPSLHHADLFGLHSWAAESSSGCCCCSHYQPVDSEDGEPVDVIGQDGHCALCDFFDQFQLVIQTDSNAETVELVALAAVLSDNSAQGRIISPQARGPPRA